MAKIEHVREAVTQPLDAEYLRRRTEAGWRLVAVEWQREQADETPAAGLIAEDVPFGLRVAPDCFHLEEEPTERQVLMLMMAARYSSITMPETCMVGCLCAGLGSADITTMNGFHLPMIFRSMS